MVIERRGDSSGHYGPKSLGPEFLPHAERRRGAHRGSRLALGWRLETAVLAMATGFPGSSRGEPSRVGLLAGDASDCSGPSGTFGHRYAGLARYTRSLASAALWRCGLSDRPSLELETGPERRPRVACTVGGVRLLTVGTRALLGLRRPARLGSLFLKGQAPAGVVPLGGGKGACQLALPPPQNCGKSGIVT
jgi:hypothetical protein